MAKFWETEFLGFPHGRPRSTYVGLISSSEGLICSNLNGECARDHLFLFIARDVLFDAKNEVWL